MAPLAKVKGSGREVVEPLMLPGVAGHVAEPPDDEVVDVWGCWAVVEVLRVVGTWVVVVVVVGGTYWVVDDEVVVSVPGRHCEYQSLTYLQ